MARIDLVNSEKAQTVDAKSGRLLLRSFIVLCVMLLGVQEVVFLGLLSRIAHLTWSESWMMLSEDTHK